MRRGYFPRHRGLAIPIFITARAWCTCRDAKLPVSFEVDGGENIPGIPGACATCNFTYLVRGPTDMKQPLSTLCSNMYSIINHCRLRLVLLVVYITNANLTNLIHYFARHTYYWRTNHFTQNQCLENLSEIFTRHIKYYRREEKNPPITNKKANCRDLRSAVRNICDAGFVRVIQKL